jgi:hypothetical protein
MSTYTLHINRPGVYRLGEPAFTGSARDAAAAFSEARVRLEGTDVTLWLHREWEDGTVDECTARHYCSPDRRGRLTVNIAKAKAAAIRRGCSTFIDHRKRLHSSGAVVGDRVNHTMTIQEQTND